MFVSSTREPSKSLFRFPISVLWYSRFHHRRRCRYVLYHVTLRFSLSETSRWFVFSEVFCSHVAPKIILLRHRTAWFLADVLRRSRTFDLPSISSLVLHIKHTYCACFVFQSVWSGWFVHFAEVNVVNAIDFCGYVDVWISGICLNLELKSSTKYRSHWCRSPSSSISYTMGNHLNAFQLASQEGFWCQECRACRR